MARRGLWVSTSVLLVVLLARPASCEAGSPRDEFLEQVDRLLNRPVARLPPRPRLSPGWPKSMAALGEVSGVSVDPEGHPVILHRGPRHWDSGTFNASAHYQHVADGPIVVDPILKLDARTGRVRDSWGRGFFYLPHGITVDQRGDVWVTDVAMHQVLKFGGRSRLPELDLGVPFHPGSDHRHLCQPTAVAVAPTPREEVYVADGYCNSRVLVFDVYGRFVYQMPRYEEFLSLRVPHGLALLPADDAGAGADPLLLLCVADRENMRVVCPRVGLRAAAWAPPPPLTLQAPDLGRVFGVAAVGGTLFAVNGPTSARLRVRGFTMDPATEAVVDRWAGGEGLETPHALAADGNGSALFVAELQPPRVWKFDLLRD